MFKAIRIAVLLLVLLVVALNSWLSRTRSTDWNESLWVTVYPINADGSAESARYIDQLQAQSLEDVEEFVAREAARYGRELKRPVRMFLGQEVSEQPPSIAKDVGIPGIMWWSLNMRWWASRISSSQDGPPPDVKIFLRLHLADDDFPLDNSVGLQKGMIGIVNARAGRRHQGKNNIVIAHELLHTLGATDKYDRSNGQPLAPAGIAEPMRSPLYPQSKAEIMAGRIALSSDLMKNPGSLRQVVIGSETAREIRLVQ